MNRLVLIDGNAIVHRAYHALPPLTAPDGSIVNAVYGFVSILIRIVGELHPTQVAVAFDRPKPTFRKALYEGYQAKRPKMDEDLVSQIDKVHEVIAAFGIPIYEVDGFEADDVLGSITKQCQMLNDKCQIVIVTGDRDLLQLVDDERVKVFMPTKGLSEGKLYGEKDVVERMGVTPRRITDLKALSGDSSDNYPGVAGIGPKTAVQLVGTFGSVESLYKALTKKDKRLAKFSAGVVEKLTVGAKDAVLFKEIASIRTDVPVGEIDRSPLASLDRPEAIAALQKFGFPSLIKRITKKDAPTGEVSKKKEKKAEDAGEQLSLV